MFTVSPRVTLVFAVACVVFTVSRCDSLSAHVRPLCRVTRQLMYDHLCCVHCQRTCDPCVVFTVSPRDPCVVFTVSPRDPCLVFTVACVVLTVSPLLIVHLILQWRQCCTPRPCRV